MVVVGGTLGVVNRNLPVLRDRPAPDRKEENFDEDEAEDTIAADDLNEAVLLWQTKPVGAALSVMIERHHFSNDLYVERIQKATRDNVRHGRIKDQ